MSAHGRVAPIELFIAPPSGNPLAPPGVTLGVECRFRENPRRVLYVGRGDGPAHASSRRPRSIRLQAAHADRIDTVRIDRVTSRRYNDACPLDIQLSSGVTAALTTAEATASNLR